MKKKRQVADPERVFKLSTDFVDNFVGNLGLRAPNP